MQAPTLPFSFHLSFGDKDQASQNLANLDLSLQNGEDKVLQIASQKDIAKEITEEFCLCCEFYVEAGCEKQAVAYFNTGFDHKDSNDLSPLQKIFRTRPDEQEVKMTVEAHSGFVRILYHFLVNGPLADQVEEIDQQLSIAQGHGLAPTLNMNLDLKGSVAHNKKNRQNVKVNWIDLHLSTEKMISKELVELAHSMEVIPFEEAEQFTAYLGLLKKLKQASIKLKFNSFRKISGFYNSLVKESGKSQTKEFPYVNRGLFRKKAEVTCIYRRKYVSNLVISFESEDVFIRLIKVYAVTLGKLFDVDLYK